MQGDRDKVARIRLFLVRRYDWSIASQKHINRTYIVKGERGLQHGRKVTNKSQRRCISNLCPIVCSHCHQASLFGEVGSTGDEGKGGEGES